jgi:hypothetical protein
MIFQKKRDADREAEVAEMFTVDGGGGGGAGGGVSAPTYHDDFEAVLNYRVDEDKPVAVQLPLMDFDHEEENGKGGVGEGGGSDMEIDR